MRKSAGLRRVSIGEAGSDRNEAPHLAATCGKLPDVVRE
jgi:hypothetical protein